MPEQIVPPSPDVLLRALRPGARSIAPAPIAFLHGLLESPAIWDEARTALAASGHRTLALPLPGHRADALHGAPGRRLASDAPRLARHLGRALAARTGGRRIRLVGHSLGGLLALDIARARPDLVRDVMVIGALHAGDCGRTRSVGSWLVTEAPAVGPLSARLLLRRWVACPRRFRAWMAASLAGGERIVADTERMRAELASADPDTLRALACELTGRDALDEIGRVPCPVTCVISARDPVVSADHQLALARALPHGVAQVIESGHLPMLTAPASLSRTLRAWAGSAPAGAPVPAARSVAANGPRALAAPDRPLPPVRGAGPGAADAAAS